MASPDPSPLGVRLITLYKLVKAVAQTLLASAFTLLVQRGLAERVHVLAVVLRDHVIHPWSLAAADVLVSATVPRHVAMAAVALGLDAGVSGVEAWALHRRRWWGPWLVVIATGGLIPFEIYEIVRHARAGRIAVLAVNVAIVIYLAARVRRERKAHAR